MALQEKSKEKAVKLDYIVVFAARAVPKKKKSFPKIILRTTTIYFCAKKTL